MMAELHNGSESFCSVTSLFPSALRTNRMSQMGATLSICFPGVVAGSMLGSIEMAPERHSKYFEKNNTLYHKILSATENRNINRILKITLYAKLKWF